MLILLYVLRVSTYEKRKKKKPFKFSHKNVIISFEARTRSTQFRRYKVKNNAPQSKNNDKIMLPQ